MPIQTQFPTTFITRLSSQGPQIVTDGLVVAYRMDEGSGQQVLDYSGNDYHAQLGSTGGADGDDPAWVAEGLDFAGGDYLTATVPDNYFTGAMTAIVVARIDLVSRIHFFVGKSDATPPDAIPFDFRTTNGGIPALVVDRGNAAAKAWTANNARLGQYRMYTVSCPVSLEDQHYIYVNTTKLICGPSGPATGAATGNEAPLRVGGRVSSTASVSLDGREAYCLLYSRQLSDAEIAQNFQALEAVMALCGVALNAAAVIFDGDSLTSGAGATAGNDYPAQCIALLGSGYDNINIGVSGQQIDHMVSDAVTQVDPMFSDVRADNIVVCWSGTNNLYDGQGAATPYSNIVSYCQGRRAAGFKVVVLTILPRSDAGIDANFETDRQMVNTNIRDNWATFADALADVAADTRIGDAGDSEDTSYYADKVHMTNAGYTIVAQIVADAIETL